MSQLALSNHALESSDAQLDANQKELGRRIDLVTRATREDIESALLKVKDGSFPRFFLDNFLAASQIPAQNVVSAYKSLTSGRTPYSVQLNSNLLGSERLRKLGFSLDVDTPTRYIQDDKYTLRSTRIIVLDEVDDELTEFHQGVTATAHEIEQSHPLLGRLLLSCSDPYALNLFEEMERFIPNMSEALNDLNKQLRPVGYKIQNRNGVVVVGTASVDDGLAVVHNREMASRVVAPFNLRENVATPDHSPELEELRERIVGLEAQLAEQASQLADVQRALALAVQQRDAGTAEITRAQESEQAALSRERNARTAVDTAMQLAEQAEAYAALMANRLATTTPDKVVARLPR